MICVYYFSAKKLQKFDNVVTKLSCVSIEKKGVSNEHKTNWYKQIEAIRSAFVSLNNSLNRKEKFFNNLIKFKIAIRKDSFIRFLKNFLTQ